MAKKKTGVRKNRRKSPPPVSIKTSLKKIFAGFALLIIIVAATGFIAKYLVLSRNSRPATQETITRRIDPEPQKTGKKAPPHKKTAALKGNRNESPSKAFPKTETPPPALIPETDSRPKMAIIIDDIGYDKTISTQLINLDTALTFAVLPHSPFQDTIARAAHEKGLELMLHLPMEPLEYPQVNPGPGALLTSMPPDQLIRQLNRDLNAVPHIAGVNNHMGSRMTAASTQMYQIFTILKKRGLYFIDSRTSSTTLCGPSARLLQIPFGERDIFLDHLKTAKAIRRQLKKLVRIAEKHGEAIGIGHPHPLTYDVLRRELPAIKKKIRLVPASNIVKPLG